MAHSHYLKRAAAEKWKLAVALRKEAATTIDLADREALIELALGLEAEAANLERQALSSD